MSAGHAGAAIREMLRFPRPAPPVVARVDRRGGGRGARGGLALALGLLDPRGSGAAAIAGIAMVAVLGKVLGRLVTWLVLTTGVGLLLGAFPLFGCSASSSRSRWRCSSR